ncbi:nucleoside triphosphate pyrophosphatase [Thermithiobacillus tepidarius DSM 3134]|uniref:Maf family protein n=1 Tax=Thermithiobacillus tepidarius TaxID=929 RepID=UPI0004194FD3|nr:nucleoside triphosphate pyrophosphatase [Thermithiobacillus tepidarius]
MARLYLASRSPRRLSLLAQLGVHAHVLPADVDETPRPGEPPAALALRLAGDKARRAWEMVQAQGLPPGPVLGSDTVVALADGRVLGKPANAADGVATLLQLAGRSHEVITAVALHGPQGERTAVSRSRVTFRAIDEAGGYAIQGLGAVFVERIEGSYSGIMGLPLFETAALLKACGMEVL